MNTFVDGSSSIKSKDFQNLKETYKNLTTNFCSFITEVKSVKVSPFNATSENSLSFDINPSSSDFERHCEISDLYRVSPFTFSDVLMKSLEILKDSRQIQR